MQLVVSGNRILAHGEGFLAMGGTVINTRTGKAYQNATVVECAGCPSDIDKVGYEYHAGQFVPCAPYGMGDGNIAVVCGEDCKSIKDSGIPSRGYLAKEVGALFGLGAGAVPNDALAFLGKYNLHWWSVLHGQASAGFEEERSAIANNVRITYVYDKTGTISYSKEIAVDQSDGTITMVDAQTLEIDLSESAAGFVADMTALLPVYITGLCGDPDSIYYLSGTSTFGSDRSCTVHAVVYNGNYSDDTGYGNEVYLNPDEAVPDAQKACVVSSRVYNIPQGEITYVQAADRNAYPDYAVVGSQVYRYLGIPFANAAPAASVNVREYTGTGIAENPVSLTFDRLPLFVVVSCMDDTTNSMAMLFPLYGYGIHVAGSSAHFSRFTVELEGKTMKMMLLDSNSDEMNIEGAKYLATAIG